MEPDPVGTMLDQLSTWSDETGRQPPIDLPHAELMLELLAEELGVTELPGLAEGTLGQLLFEVYPDAADIELDDLPSVLATAGDLLDYAADRHLLPAATVEALRGELAECGPLFLAAAADFADDESSVDEVDLKQVFGLPDRLPPMRLPSEPELARAARDSVLLGEVRHLAEQDDGPEPGQDAETEHVRALAEELGFADPADDGHVVACEDAPAWPDVDDDEALAVWQHALSSVLAWSLALDADASGGTELDLASAGAAFMVLFLTGRDGMARAEWSAMIEDAVTEHLPESQARQAWDAWVTEHGDPGTVLAERLERLGAVTLEDEVLRMTPPAQHTLRLELLDAGVEVPLLPPVEEMTAADVVEVALTAGPEEAAEESEAWMRLRPAEAAAGELLDVARDGGPGERGAAALLVLPLGSAAEQAWRSVLDVPSLRPYAKQALSQFTDSGPELSAEDSAWLLVDALSEAELRFEPEELAEAVASVVPAGELGIFERVWRLDHPNAHEVLTLVGRYHPDKTTAKAARKAAFKVTG